MNKNNTFQYAFLTIFYLQERRHANEEDFTITKSWQPRFSHSNLKKSLEEKYLYRHKLSKYFFGYIFTSCLARRLIYLGGSVAAMFNFTSKCRESVGKE